MTWDLSCPQWQEKLARGESLIPQGLPLNLGEANRAETIFGNLRLPDVSGMPLLSSAAGPWFTEIVRTLFGAYNSTTGAREINEVFCLVPKKNSKTTYAAGLMLTALIMSPRPRAEFVMVAPTIDVAELAFSQAVGMIEAEPTLRTLMHIQAHVRRITFRRNGCYLKIRAFDPKTVTGSRAAGVLLDETHVISEYHDADRVLGQLRGGLVSQPEAFLVQITTQSERPPAGVFKAELRKARAVRDGNLRASILPVLYELPAGSDWRDQRQWPLVLPNLGRSITVERLSREYDAANEAGPEELRRWASQHLNVEVGLSLVADGWAGAEFWADCAADDLSLSALLERCEVATVGIDGGGLDDLLSLCVLGRETTTGRWLHYTKSWIAPEVLQRRKSEAQRLHDFMTDGDLVLVDRLRDDVSALVAEVKLIEDSGLLAMVGVDPVGISMIVDGIEKLGVKRDDRIVAVPQGWRLSGAIKTTERRLAEGSLQHGGRPIMSWSVGNARVEPRGNAVTITKQAAGVAKIDPLMATFDAVELMTRNPRPKRKRNQMLFI